MRAVSEYPAMIYKDFEPSSTYPSPEEIGQAHSRQRQAILHGKEIPEDALDIYARMDAYTREFTEFMRSDTKEIIAKMLPEGTPLTLSKLMDMLHVYFWWDMEIGMREPIEYFENLIKDFDDERFAEAVEVVHSEFAEDCHKHKYDYDSESDSCESSSGMDCYVWYVSLNESPQAVDRIMQDPWQRADKLNMMFYESLHGDEEDYGETPEDEDIAEESRIIYNMEPRTHTLQTMLGQHAVQRLVEAGADDIEAMDATAVLDLEQDLRSTDYEMYASYKEFRDVGGDLESWTRVHAQAILEDEKLMEVIVEDFAWPGINLANLSNGAQKALVARYIAENHDDLEKLEVLYQLQEEGISPFYRRRMAEDNFPAADRI